MKQDYTTAQPDMDQYREALKCKANDIVMDCNLSDEVRHNRLTACRLLIYCSESPEIHAHSDFTELLDLAIWIHGSDEYPAYNEDTWEETVWYHNLYCPVEHRIPEEA